MKFSILFLILCSTFSGTLPRYPLPADVCLNSEERKLYDMIMDYRKSRRLKAIPYSAKLTQVAQAHVRDLMANYDYANRGDCNPHSWSGKGKWTACCYTPDHKSAACMWNKPREISGYAGDGFEIAYYSSGGATASDGLAGWKSSSGHNPLLVNTGIWAKKEWKGLGIGIYQNFAVVWFGDLADPSEMNRCP